MDTLLPRDREHYGRSSGERLRAVENAINRARTYLLGLQSPAGYWVGELEADASVSAGYIPLVYYMVGDVDPERKRKAANYVKSKQQSDGSWSSYEGGPGDLNVTIQVYFALKLAGASAEEPFMRRAREFILAKGGIAKANALTKIWLALFGQFDWHGVPSVPPELILLPNWFYFNIYEFASWSRATIVALAIVLTNKPVCRVPESAQLDELYLEPKGQRRYAPAKIDGLLSWRTFFALADSFFKMWERLPVKPGRGLALCRVERWIVDHQEADGSWGGVMLPWIYSLMALKSQGYPMHHPVIAKGMKGLEGFIKEDEATLRLQPATSPVWDTAWSILALREAGLPADHPALRRAAGWLLEQEVRIKGDWQVKNPATEAGCWAFEFENDLYPDADDTATVARALGMVQLDGDDEEAKYEAIDRAARWVASMQCKNGGWAAFDLNNDKAFLAHVPFADFMTPLDPTCADVTAHVLELLGELGDYSTSIRDALAYLWRTQEPDGSWYGRWGVNYIYGTTQALAALNAIGGARSQANVQRAVSWIASKQNPDGGWGESCRSYEDPRCRGTGSSIASQTAWALLGLMAAGQIASPGVQRGIDYLICIQQADGSWKEGEYTGTGFPRAFYLRYNLYSAYFPLMALARYRNLMEGSLT